MKKEKSSSKSGVALVLSALLVATSAQAEYYWNNAAGGSWDDSANWQSNSGTGTYPGDASMYDNIGASKVQAPFTVTLRKNERAWDCILGPLSGSGAQRVDLGGHSLAAHYLQYQGCGAPSAHNVLPARYVEFCHGVLNLSGSGIYIGSGANSSPGSIVFSDCVVTARLELASIGSSLVVREGSTWVHPTTHDIKIPYEKPSQPVWARAYFSVTGSASRVEAPNNDLYLQQTLTGFYLFEGTSASFKNVKIGPTDISADNVMDVRGGTLDVSEDISIGADNATSTRSKLLVQGAAARVTASSLTVYDGEACELNLTIPTTGFDKDGETDAAPLQFGTVSLVPRAEGRENFGDFAFKVACYEWMMANSEKTIPLVTLTEADEEALTALMGTVEWADVPSALIEAGKGPALSLSEDGKSLLVTSPKISYIPNFTVSTLAGDAVGAKKFAIGLFDYGAGASSIVSILLEYADNPDFTGSTSVELLKGTPISAPVPCELVYSINGDFVQHKAYYAKVALTNERSYEEAVETVFFGDGLAEEFNLNGTNDGNWEDAGRWKVGDITVDYFPHGEDSVLLGWGGDITLSLNNDREIYCFVGDNAQFPRFAYPGNRTFDLRGNTFTIKRVGALFLCCGATGTQANMDLDPIGFVMTFKNGTVVSDTAAVNSGFSMGTMAAQGSGTLVMDNADVTMRCRYLNNSSRIFVRNGAIWRVPDAFVMAGHTALTPYPVLCVTGAQSRVVSDADLTVRGNGAAMYVLDGGSVSCGTFWIGRTSSVSFGDVSSDCTLVKVDGGTIAATGDLNLGWPDDLKLSPKLVIGGTNAAVTAGAALNIYEKLGVEIEFALPSTGYDGTPLKATSLAFVPRTAGYADYGATKIVLTGVKAWARLHPEETIELVRLTTPNAAGLESLKANATVDWGKMDASALSVSADGTALTLTAPPLSGFMLILR